MVCEGFVLGGHFKCSSGMFSKYVCTVYNCYAFVPQTFEQTSKNYTMKLQTHCFFGPSQPGNTIWAKSRKYNMGQKPKIHAEANAGNTSGPHDVRRLASACILCLCPILHFLHLAHLVLFCFLPVLYLISFPVYRSSWHSRTEVVRM